MGSSVNGTLAVFGGAPVRGPEKAWPSWPQFDDAERAALLGVLESGKWFYGDRVAAFEGEYAAFQGARHCVTANSGTTALEIVLQAMGIGPGDEVIVPPFTFVATASAVLRVGARPVFADLDSTWCLDPDRVAEALTPRTKAIMPVHFGGRFCDMDRLCDIAADAGIRSLRTRAMPGAATGKERARAPSASAASSASSSRRTSRRGRAARL